MRGRLRCLRCSVKTVPWQSVPLSARRYGPRLAGCCLPFCTGLYGKGYGHAHTEKESGEDGVGESHHVFVHPGMHQPVGHVFQSGMSLTKSMRNMVSARNTSTAAIRWSVKLFMIDNLFGVLNANIGNYSFRCYCFAGFLAIFA